MKRKKVYVAGPYSSEPVLGVQAACKMATRLWDAGFCPIVPHLTHLWHLVEPKPYEWWLAYDIELLRSCAYLLRISGKSEGADAEVLFAELNGIPVYFQFETFVEQVAA